MGGDSFGFGLLRRREMVVPTWRGLAIAVLGASIGGVACFRSVHPFLAITRPIGGEALVVEGWVPDYAMREALALFRSRRYSLLVTTGGPLPQGSAYASYGTHAKLAAVALEGFGLSSDSIVVVPSPEVPRDRTYQEGLSLREWMASRPVPLKSLDVYSFSTHARRSRLLYRMALGPDVEVGVYASRDLGYDPARWWSSSNGVRRVGDEVIAYLYAKVLFRE